MKKIRMCVDTDKTFAEGFDEYILECKSRNLRVGTLRHYRVSIPGLSSIDRTRQRIISAAFLLLPFQKVNVFINRCSAQITHPRQLAYIQLLLLVGGIMAKEHGGNIIHGCLRSADLGSLGFGICHS